MCTVQYYDIRKKCETNLCYDFSNMETLLNQKSVRQALGVGDIDFVSCSTEVYDAMQMDWMRNLEVGIPALLEDGVKLLVYAGENDLICNWLGKHCPRPTGRAFNLIQISPSILSCKVSLFYCRLQGTLGGCTPWNGLDRKILQQLVLYPSLLTVKKQDS